MLSCGKWPLIYGNCWYGRTDCQISTIFEKIDGLIKKGSFGNPGFRLPSGKLAYLWKITILHGKTHYFCGRFQYQRVNPIRSQQTTIKSPMNNRHCPMVFPIELNNFSMVFLCFSYGFPMVFPMKPPFSYVFFPFNHHFPRFS